MLDSKAIVQLWRRQKDAHYASAEKAIKRIKPYRGKSLDKLAGEIHDEVFNTISCLDCANCCSTIPPLLHLNDQERLSKALKIDLSEFQERYVTVDEDGDSVLNQVPCPFLFPDNKCRVYESRPDACREYPHTDALQFSKNLAIHAVNVKHCPAVGKILAEIESRLP